MSLVTTKEDLEYAASYLDTDVDDSDGVRRRRVASFLRHEAGKPTMQEMAERIIGGLTEKEHEALEAFNEKKRQMRRTEAEQVLDRVRIVRNSIVRKWQRAKEVCEELPENAASKEHLRREMGGLMAALEELYGEFDELERMALDQKPRCPFCQEEMEHPALADHMKEHLKKGHYPLVNSGSDLQRRVDAFSLLMQREMDFVGWDGDALELLHGIASKLQDLGLMEAGGTGDAAHPDPDPTEDE